MGGWVRVALDRAGGLGSGFGLEMCCCCCGLRIRKILIKNSHGVVLGLLFLEPCEVQYFIVDDVCVR